MKKSNRELERIVKGFANHRRLQILELLGEEPELSVQEVSDKLKSEFKNISAHMNKWKNLIAEKAQQKIEAKEDKKVREVPEDVLRKILE